VRISILNKNRLKPKNRICQNVRFRAFTDAKESMTSSKSIYLLQNQTVFREIRPLNGLKFSGMWNHVSRTTTWHVFVESLAEIDQRNVVEVLHVTKKQRLCDPFFLALSETHCAIRPQPHVSKKFHPNRSKFARVISEIDLPDRHNNRRCSSEIGSPITMMALEWEIKHRSLTYIITQPNSESLFVDRKENHT